MAKKLHKKQRIAYNKTLNEDNGLFPKDCHFLSNLMLEMKNKNYTLPSMHSNKFESDLMEFRKNPSQKKTQSSKIINPIQNHASVPKSKKFGGVSRKCPLMEKSQRDLKQIKHNRKIPKPRAHLAALLESPVSKPPPVQIHFSSNVKFKKIKVAGNKGKNTDTFQKFTEVPQNDKISSKQYKPSVLKRNNSAEHFSLQKRAFKKQDFSSTIYSSEKSWLDNPKNTDSSSDSDGYEKFIQKEKSDIQKKPKSKKSLNSLTKNVAKKRSLRTISKPLLSESDEEFTLPISYHKRNKRRKRIIVENRQSASFEKSESETDIINYKTRHDTSSKSDDLTLLSKLKNNLQPPSNTDGSPFVREMSKDNSEQKNLSSRRNLYKASKVRYDQQVIGQKTSDPASSFVSQPTVFPELPRSASLKGRTNVHKRSNVQSSLSISMSNVHPVFSHKTSETASEMGSVTMPCKTNGASTKDVVGNGKCSTKNDLLNAIVKLKNSNKSEIVFHETSGTASEMGSVAISCNTNGTSSKGVIGNGECPTKDDLFNASDKQENSNKSEIVDLTESDNEGHNSFTIMPKIVMVCSLNENKSSTDCGKVDTDEDSEIEMVDAIVHDLIKKRKNSDGNIQQNSSNNKDELQIKADVNISPPSSNVKTQKQSNKLQTSFTKIPVKNEAIFSTDICKEIHKNKSKIKTLKQSNLKCDKSQMNTGTTEENSLVKNEAVFSTDICKEIHKNESKNKTLKQSNLKCDKPQMNPGATEENSLVLNKKMKTESSDCEVIFDTDSNSNTRQNFNSAPACSKKTIEIEKEFKVVKQNVLTGNNSNTSKDKELLKGKDFGSSDLSNAIDTCNRNPILFGEEEIGEYLKALFEELKHESGKYQEIVHAEQSLEASLKILEMHQADKVKFIKAQIDKFLKISSVGSKQHNVFKEMIHNSSQISSLKALPPASPSANIPNSNKILATMAIVPLSSISEMDIKASLTEMQSSLKKEPRTSEDIKSMSFGEKCIVCSKNASAACQQCAKVFFCSQECGRKYWNEGHKDACAK